MQISQDKYKLNIFDTTEELVASLSDKIAEVIKHSLSTNQKCHIALSGGSTPKVLYEYINNNFDKYGCDWSKVFFYLGDERCVSNDSNELNANMIRQSLFKDARLPIENFFVTCNQDSNPNLAAENYAHTIAQNLPLQKWPVFDIVLLGLGPDGHTASLFPGTKALENTTDIFVANYVDKFSSYRLTLTYNVINNAKNQIFVVTGDSKSKIVKEILTGTHCDYPSMRIKNNHNQQVIFFTDKLAVKDLIINN